MMLQLISHDLCPYVQRAVISLTEKGVPFERSYIDLGNKPDWFLAISPLGKTPVLLADGGKILGALLLSAPLALILAASPNRRAIPLEKLFRAAGKLGALFGARYNEYAVIHGE